METVMESKVLTVVGKIVKPHGLEGGVKVKPFTDNLDGFGDYESFFVQEGDSVSDLTLRVRKVKPLNGWLIIYFDGINDIEGAEKLKNMSLRVDRKTVVDKKSLSEDDVLIDDLVGYRVVDEEGRYLGYVDGFYDGGVTGLYLVKYEESNYDKDVKNTKPSNQDFFIPCDLSFYQKIDFEHRKIVLNSGSFLR